MPSDHVARSFGASTVSLNEAYTLKSKTSGSNYATLPLRPLACALASVCTLIGRPALTQFGTRGLVADEDERDHKGT
jgi:hypothetical protein